MSTQTLFTPVRRPLAILLALLAAVSGLLLPGAKPAGADTPFNRISFTYMEVESWGNADYAESYHALIASIRNAAAHRLRDDVFETQDERVSLMSVRLYSGNTWLRLWIEPHNLYLRGFTNIHGTFMAADPEYNLRDTLAQFPTYPSNDQNTGFVYDPAGGGTLPFNSTYGSINRAADRDRADLPISAQSAWNYFYQLAYVQRPWEGNARRATASSYLFFTQFISEATRFDDIYYYMHAAVGDSNWRRDGMGENQIAMANNWARISDWARAYLGPTHPGPLVIIGLHVINNWEQLRRVLNTAKHR